MTDREFLADQQRHAMRGIRRAASDIGGQIEGALDLRGRVRRHPWLSLGAGAAAGLAIGRFLPAVSLGPILAVAGRPIRLMLQTLVATAIAEKSVETVEHKRP
jgi:hypothetical protein